MTSKPSVLYYVEKNNTPLSRLLDIVVVAIKKKEGEQVTTTLVSALFTMEMVIKACDRLQANGVIPSAVVPKLIGDAEKLGIELSFDEIAQIINATDVNTDLKSSYSFAPYYGPITRKTCGHIYRGDFQLFEFHHSLSSVFRKLMLMNNIATPSEMLRVLRQAASHLPPTSIDDR